MMELERCREWIEAALEYNGGCYSFDDVAQGIMEGRMQLWAGPDGCAVTEILMYPQRKLLNLFLAGGSMEQLLDMEKDAITWAKAQGCDGLSLSGRKGWTRALKERGWNTLHTTLIREF